MILRRLINIIILFLVTHSPAYPAGESLSISEVRKENISEVPLRIPKKELINNYLKDKDYRYGGELRPIENFNFFNNLWNRLLTIIKKLMIVFKYLPVALQILFYVACAFLIYIIVTKTKLYRLFYTEQEIKNADFIEVDLLDKEFNFDDAIFNQLSQKNFRNAIRLLYLKILKELDSNEFIKYSKEKTNREYSREIKNDDLRVTFYQLTNIYNRIWYGNYALSKEEYELFADSFYHFSTEINADKE